MSSEPFDEYGYKLAYIHGERRVKRCVEYLGTWEGYSGRDDQWVRADDVRPKSKITKFYGVEATVPVLQQPLRFLRNGIIARLASGKISERTPVWQEKHEIPQLCYAEIARALLEWARVSHREKNGKIVELKGGGFELELESQAHIGEVLSIHAERPEYGVANLKIKSGGASYEDMTMLTGLTLRWTGAKFEAELTTVTFHGKKGTPTFPKAGTVDKYTLAERGAIVKQAKKILLQEWSPAPIKNHLVKKGWYALPKGTWQFSDAVAYKGAEIALPRAQWPTCAADVEKPPRAPAASVD